MEFNWLSMVIAAFVPTVVGFIWYHPKAFGNVWMQSIGMTEEKAKQGNMAMIFGLSLAVSFFIAFFMSTNVNFGGGENQHGEVMYQTFRHGAFHGVFLTILIVFPILLTNTLFEQKSFKYAFINTGYWLITLLVMGGIVSAWH